MVDWRKQETLIEGGVVYDEESDNPKTAKACKVKLNSLTKNALSRQKFHTFLNGDHLFHDPDTSMA